MGMYTALHFACELKRATPPTAIGILRLMTTKGAEDRFVFIPDHPLFGDTYRYEEDERPTLIFYPPDVSSWGR